jgi:hypothetical protein
MIGISRRFALRTAVAALGLGVTVTSAFAACLTTPTDQVGNVQFGATVQTFINLGINPNTTCIENALWTDPAGFTLGTYVKGAEGMGGTPNPLVLNYNGATVNGTLAGNANARDFFWVQDTGNQGTFNGAIGGAPSQGIVWNLGGQANQVAVFVQVDHGPVPQEVLENTAWLSNNPNAADGGWTQASLVLWVWLVARSQHRRRLRRRVSAPERPNLSVRVGVLGRTRRDPSRRRQRD